MATLSPIPTGHRSPTERHATLDRRKSITFKGKSFYLDLPHNKNSQVLTKAISRLGGVIEGFLSRDVHYVVTGGRKASDNSCGSSVAGRRGGPSKRHAAENIEPALCRGKQLLKKAIQNQERSSVLANAQSWGVCILHVDEVLRYLQHSTHSTSKGKAAVGAGQVVKVGKLKDPFLKIEDRNRKYRPLQHCFTSFPEISFISSDRSPFETACTNSTHKEKDAGDQEEDGERSQRPNAREKSGYCECCQMTYTKLSEHLISEQHGQFSLDPSNYKVIDDIACNITCDLMEYTHGILPVSERDVDDGPVSVEDAQDSVVKEGSKMRVSEVPCDENDALMAEDNTAHIIGEAYRLSVKNAVTSEQEENMDVTMVDGDQRQQFAEDTNDVPIQCKESLQQTRDTEAASHVDVVTEVFWYTEEVGLTSVYTVQSLAIPPDGQQAQLAMANVLETFSPPLLLSPLADSQGALGTEHPSEAQNAPILKDPLSGAQITNPTSAHCNELLVEQTSILKVGEQCQELFAEPSTGNVCGVNLLDSFVQLPAEETRVEEMIDLQQGSIRLHNTLLLPDDQTEPLLNVPARLHTQMDTVLSQDGLNVIPLFAGPRDTFVVTSSSAFLTNNSDREALNQLNVMPLASASEQNQLNVMPLCQGLADTSIFAQCAASSGNEASASAQNQLNVIPLSQGLADAPVFADGAASSGNKASALEHNQLNITPLCQGLEDRTELGHDSTSLVTKASTPQQNPLNVIPLYLGPAVTHSTKPLGNEAHTLEQNPLQSTADICSGKRKHNWSSSPPPAKRPPSQYRSMSLPMWAFYQLPDSGLQPTAHSLPDLVEKGKASVTNEGTIDSASPYFSPKLIQYDASSESDWDLGLVAQQQCKQQPGAQLGDLRTTRVNLDESWYGKELCSVLAQDQNLGSLYLTDCHIGTPIL